MTQSGTKPRRVKRVIHCSDGVYEEYSSDEEGVIKISPNTSLVDPVRTCRVSCVLMVNDCIIFVWIVFSSLLETPGLGPVALLFVFKGIGSLWLCRWNPDWLPWHHHPQVPLRDSRSTANERRRGVWKEKDWCRNGWLGGRPSCSAKFYPTSSPFACFHS